MDIIGDRKFVEVPGEKTHELPPLLVRTTPNVKRLDLYLEQLLHALRQALLRLPHAQQVELPREALRYSHFCEEM